MLDKLLKDCDVDCSLLSEHELEQAYSKISVYEKSGVMNAIYTGESKRLGISFEQCIFNEEVKQLVHEKKREQATAGLKAKWRVELETGVLQAAQEQEDERDLVLVAKEWMSNGTKPLKANKTSLNELIRWSSSKHAEMRKSDVVAIVLDSVLDHSFEKMFMEQFSSGSASEYGYTPLQGEYTLLRVRGCTLLNTHEHDRSGKLLIYRFNDEVDIEGKLNSFTFDETLADKLYAYRRDVDELEVQHPLLDSGQLPF